MPRKIYRSITVQSSMTTNLLNLLSVENCIIAEIFRLSELVPTEFVDFATSPFSNN